MDLHSVLFWAAALHACSHTPSCPPLYVVTPDTALTSSASSSLYWFEKKYLNNWIISRLYLNLSLAIQFMFFLFVYALPLFTSPLVRVPQFLNQLTSFFIKCNLLYSCLKYTVTYVLRENYFLVKLFSLKRKKTKPFFLLVLEKAVWKIPYIYLKTP